MGSGSALAVLNADYEGACQAVCQRATAEGIAAVAFGDLFLRDIRDYRVQQLQGTGLEPLFPVWRIPTDQLGRDMIAAGPESKAYLRGPLEAGEIVRGPRLRSAVAPGIASGIDPCGENGEFHALFTMHPCSPVNRRSDRRNCRAGWIRIRGRASRHDPIRESLLPVFSDPERLNGGKNWTHLYPRGPLRRLD
jgi:diphthamide synthase (EF-2-diphthine--ammonia ligase)